MIEYDCYYLTFTNVIAFYTYMHLHILILLITAYEIPKRRTHIELHTW